MGWGSSTQRGGGRKVRALPRKFVFLGFRREESGCPGNFAGMSRTSGGVQKVCAKKVRAHFSFPILVDVSDFFFSAWEGEGGVRGAGRRGGGGGIGFSLKIPRGGGGALQDGRGQGAGRVSAANWVFWGGGGGTNIFFRGRNVHQAIVQLPSTSSARRPLASDTLRLQVSHCTFARLSGMA